MESDFKSEDAKPAGDTARNLVLAICYSGLFLLVAGAISMIAILALGDAPQQILAGDGRRGVVHVFVTVAGHG